MSKTGRMRQLGQVKGHVVSSQRSLMENGFLHRTPETKGVGHKKNSKIIKRIRLILTNDYCIPTMYHTYRVVHT